MGTTRAVFTAALGATLTVVFSSAPAAEQVVVNDTKFYCQNSCEVYRDMGGQLRVRDTKGGWVIKERINSPIVAPLPSSASDKAIAQIRRSAGEPTSVEGN